MGIAVTSLSGDALFRHLLRGASLVIGADACDRHFRDAELRLAALRCLGYDDAHRFAAEPRRHYARLRWLLSPECAAWWDERIDAAARPLLWSVADYDFLKLRAEAVALRCTPLADVLRELPEGFADVVDLGGSCIVADETLVRSARRVVGLGTILLGPRTTRRLPVVTPLRATS